MPSLFGENADGIDGALQIASIVILFVAVQPFELLATTVKVVVSLII